MLLRRSHNFSTGVASLSRATLNRFLHSYPSGAEDRPQGSTPPATRDCCCCRTARTTPPSDECPTRSRVRKPCSYTRCDSPSGSMKRYGEGNAQCVLSDLTVHSRLRQRNHLRSSQIVHLQQEYASVVAAHAQLLSLVVTVRADRLNSRRRHRHGGILPLIHSTDTHLLQGPSALRRERRNPELNASVSHS